MNDCAIIGKANVGKTLFFINFSEYLGLRKMDIESVDFKGRRHRKRLSTRDAIIHLTDGSPHKTLELQSLVVNIPLNKGSKRFKLIDTVGLTDGIHPSREVRRAISDTLAIIRESHLILHLMDASSADTPELPEALGEVDYQVAQFAQIRRGYVILTNKMDLPGAQRGLNKIKDEFPNNLILPISAKYKRGFRGVKVFVANNI